MALVRHIGGRGWHLQNWYNGRRRCQTFGSWSLPQRKGGFEKWDNWRRRRQAFRFWADLRWDGRRKVGTNQPFVCRQTGSQKVQYLDSPKVQYQNLGILYQYSQILSKSTISDAPQDDTSPTSLIVRRGNEAQHNCTRYSRDSVPGTVCPPSWIEIRVWMRLILLLTDGHQVPIHHPCDNCSATPDLRSPLQRMWTIGQGTHCFCYT